MPPSASSRFRHLAQALVAALSLVLAERMARVFGLERAAGVKCLSSLASLVLTATALGVGLGAPWQLKQPMDWLMMVNLCILITNSPPFGDSCAFGCDQAGLRSARSGGLAVLLEAVVLTVFGSFSAPARFKVAHRWCRSAAHGAMLATATLVTTPIALQQHWHASGLWLIITPLLVLQPFVRDSWTVALHHSLGTLAGVLLVYLMADKRVFASALGITMALSLMALAHPIERRLAQSAQG